ncbi:uncharacterized protein HKW66_Vig0160480 [Vigna angularis]|uniref:Uncharacterized protein n=1 Tax=Phaseolus angularis TaxID=3914 RepID=A0A8T0JIN1_PHAAN|nr:uncharacterized protein HKW66_Vig0160480 [Vigna angularis]
MGQESRLGYGCLTPDGAESTNQNIYVENQISKVATLANSNSGHPSNATLIDHRGPLKVYWAKILLTEKGCKGTPILVISVNCYKEFNFDTNKGVVSGTGGSGSEWWTNIRVAGRKVDQLTAGFSSQCYSQK